MKYAYSLDEEDYVGPFDTYKEAYNEGVVSVEENWSFWIAEVIDTVSKLRDDAEHIADWVIDIVETKMWDFVSAEDDILEFTRDQLKTMGNGIIDIVFANCKVVRFGVENAVEVYIWGRG